MVSVEVIASPPSYPPSYPSSSPYSKFCRIFNQIVDPNYNTEIIYIIQRSCACLLAFLCITLCVLSYLNSQSEHLHFKKFLCNLFLIIILSILFSSSFLWEPICN